MGYYSSSFLYFVLGWGSMVLTMEGASAVARTLRGDDSIDATIIYAILCCSGFALSCIVCISRGLGTFSEFDEEMRYASIMALIGLWVLGIACGIPYGILMTQRVTTEDFLNPNTLTTINCSLEKNRLNPDEINFVRFGENWADWRLDDAQWRQKAQLKRGNEWKHILCLKEIIHSGTGPCAAEMRNYSFWVQCNILTYRSEDNYAHNMCTKAMFDQCSLNAAPYEVTMRVSNNRNTWFNYQLKEWANVKNLISRPGKQVLIFEYASPGPDEFVEIRRDINYHLEIIRVVCYSAYGLWWGLGWLRGWGNLRDA